MSSSAAYWHHGPLHILLEQGVYMVTAGTYQKTHFFNTPKKLTLLHDQLHACALEFGWTLHAWAVMANHYHFIAASAENAKSLKPLVGKLHSTTAIAINKLDAIPGRKIWHQYWDTHLTYERSYLARLHYVHTNPAHHRIVTVANQYEWCSAAHFESEAEPSFQRTVYSMPTEQLNVNDDF